MIRPLPLSLEAGYNRVVAHRFLCKPKLCQSRVARHQVTHDLGHFHNRFPFVLFAFTIRLQMGSVVIRTFATILLHPCQRELILLGVVDFFFDTASKFAHIHVFIAHTQILLEK
ncbi:hypothetical protein D3C74_376230 [compost metagenome]